MQIKPCIGGENIGLLTDAGCPNIADPGAKLILHACKTVDNLSSTDKQFRKFVEDLGKKLSV